MAVLHATLGAGKWPDIANLSLLAKCSAVFSLDRDGWNSHIQSTMNMLIRAPQGAATQTEVERRRTFAIISHPDAGKTTLTEKLLLFGGAIQLAGEVKARGAAAGALGLDGGRARARHLGLLGGDELRV